MHTMLAKKQNKREYFIVVVYNTKKTPIKENEKKTLFKLFI